MTESEDNEDPDHTAQMHRLGLPHPQGEFSDGKALNYYSVNPKY